MTFSFDTALRPYQREGADFLADASPAAFLAHDPGLGKSLQTLAALYKVRAKRVLILAPAIGRVSWAEQIERWAPERAFVLVTGKTKSLPDGPLIAVVSYDALQNVELFRLLCAENWDVLVCDEAHYLKSPDAKRTKAVYGPGIDGKDGLASRAKQVWLLSGSPCPNHTGELWTHVHALFPWVMDRVYSGRMTHHQWLDAFCDLRHDPRFPRPMVRGSKNAHVLRPYLKGVLLRRRKAEVLQELPPLQFVPEPVDVDALPAGAASLLATDAKMRDQLPAEAEHWTDEQVTDFLLSEEVHLSTLRRNLGLLKAPLCAAWITNYLEGAPGKLLVGAVHTSVIDALMERLTPYGAAKIDGRDSLRARDLNVKRFQSDPTCRVFVGQIQAAGTAITLTAASDIAFCEWSWTHEDNNQFASRAHRMGQVNGVLARFLSVPGTLDMTIARAAARKAATVSELLDQ